MRHRRLAAIALSVTLAWAGFSTAAVAAVVGTADALGMEQRDARLAAVQAGLARSEVQQAMIELGVDPAEAQLRAAALSEQELAQLQGQLEQLPAGGVLELIGAVFVVLLILELTGVIDIFKKA